MSPSSIFQIIPGVQSYDWGKKGSASLAAQLGDVSIPDFKIDEGKTYAELWMGTHSTLPSKLTSDSSLLSEHLAAYTELIGEEVSNKFEVKDGALPFLFKVLSIGTALSIQAHPDKKLAKKLFEERPEVYKDPNHKPEMAIALTPFLAFLNFLPLPTLLLNLLTVSELKPIIPSDLVNSLASALELPTTLPPDVSQFAEKVKSAGEPGSEQKEILKKIFEALMSAEQAHVETAIKALLKRYTSGSGEVGENEKSLVDLFIMLNEQYPSDVGVLCVFFLNVVELKKGEAAFLEANSPHAYIKGDIIECMATSDNVVRAGLTPKLRDVSTLINMLTYHSGPGEKQLLQPTSFGQSSNTQLYDPPIAEFSVLRVALRGSEEGRSSTHRPIRGPSIAIVTQGKGTVSIASSGASSQDKVSFVRGDTLFISAGVEVTWENDKESETETEVFRAYVEA